MFISCIRLGCHLVPTTNPMKKILIAALSVVGAAGACAQGTVNFDEIPGAVTVLIYAPQVVLSYVEATGNSAADTPAGTTDYTGVPIGGASTGTIILNSLYTDPAGWRNGNNFTAELYGTAGTVATLFSQLSPLTQYTSTFATTPAGAGQFLGASPNSDPGIPGAIGGTGAVLSLAVWYNGGGTIASLSAAEAVGAPYGWSPLFYVGGPLGGQGIPPTPPPNLVGLQSFSLIFDPTPEPGTITLVGIGAAAWLVFRRKQPL